MRRLREGFFQRDAVTCARELIGCRLVWHGCVGRIVETEAYAAADDPACHTWVRPSARAFVASHHAGDAYVYLSFGNHWLFNILVKGPSAAGFVLLRALEPVAGLALMRSRRGAAVKDALLAAGPGRLGRAFGIDGSVHGLGFLRMDDCGILRGESLATCAGPRIGISRATGLPWRFGDPASASLSRRF